MSRADSPLQGKMIFCFGARRSGTWWLQRIVTAHPRVAAVPSESFFFSHAIAPLMDRFQDVEPDGLSTGRIYADRELLLDALREFCDRIFAQFLTDGAERVSERTPWHVQHLELMNELYPDAHYVHIYRDGRDSARSLASMKWYDGTLEDAAAEWRESVLAPRSVDLPARYTEIQYERLLTDPRPAIVELFEFLELDADDAVLDAALAEAQRELSTDPRSNVGTEKWRELLTAEQQATILRIAGDALASYGYVDEDELATPPPDGGAAERSASPARRLLRRARSD